jgi:putative FmdB family regulatory protein
MPLYEYRCKTCGEVFEKMVRWTEAERTPVCPHCQSQNTQKKISFIASMGSSDSGSSVTSSSCGSSGPFR